MRIDATTGAKPESTKNDIEDHVTDPPESQITISIFLGILVVTAFLMPSIGFGNSEWLYSNIVFALLIGTGIIIAWRQRGLFIVSALIGAIALSLRCLALLAPSTLWQFASEVATLLAIFAIMAILSLRILFRKGLITAVSIQAAIAIYLLFGLAWANAYLIVIQLNPHSFQSALSLSSTSVSGWYYYSYVTLTTLGYGDIIPLAKVSRSLAVGEALTGQLYLAVLVARLISMEITAYSTKNSKS